MKEIEKRSCSGDERTASGKGAILENIEKRQRKSSGWVEIYFKPDVGNPFLPPTLPVSGHPLLCGLVFCPPCTH